MEKDETRRLRALADAAWERGSKDVAESLHEAARREEGAPPVGYDDDDPKHPDYHERLADLWDSREK